MERIYVIAGKARHGKDTTALAIKKAYKDKKVINLAYGNYIKEFAKKISGWDGSEEGKPRELLQTLGTDIVRDKIDKDFFVKRLCDDIKVYSYYFDIITISDARFPNEIEFPKKLFDKVISIKVIRTNFKSPLTKKQQNHPTEIALDNYDNFDFILENDKTIADLEKKVQDIVKKVEHEY
ncbi:MAG: hypothetical protein IKG27_04780 [Bacilli bacterium]|nr:hypothetical protein [Bacilli bacterium]